jgi:hypothetical protein
VSHNVRALRPKVYHRGVLVNEYGRVSALCFVRPQPIDLGRASWTMRDDGVTCPKCKLKIRKQAKP